MRSIRRIIFFLCYLVLLFIFVPSVSAENAVIKSNNLNVRNGPGETYPSIGQVHKDETHTILDQQHNWVEIKFEEDKGWISMDYITIENEKEHKKQLLIANDHTHLRDGPSTDRQITDFAERKEMFEVVSFKDGWYKVKNDNKEGYIHEKLASLSTTTRFSGVRNKTVVIDPGHGGRDVGAIGVTGVLEKQLADKTASELADELTILGANVILTRTKDEFISLASRTSLTNISQADAFLSLHYNSVPQLPTVTGIQTYYFMENSKGLAQSLQTALIQETGAKNRGAHKEDFYVIRQNRKQAILLELGFISNSESEQQLSTQAYQKKIVTGIIKGLNNYFNAAH